MYDSYCNNHNFILCAKHDIDFFPSILGSCVYEKNTKGKLYIYVTLVPNVFSTNIVFDEEITPLISIIAGFINNLAPRGYCQHYLNNTVDPVEVFEPIISNCGCDDYFICRDLSRVPIPHPITHPFQLICKKNATADCKSSVQTLFQIWIQVPTKDDPICSDAYNWTKIWATSCN